MASLTLIDAYASTAANHEIQHLRALWNVFLESIEQCTPYLILSHNLIAEIGLGGLRDITTRYSSLAAEEIHVFTDSDRDAYLIGPLVNLPSGPNITPFGLIVDHGRSEPRFINEVPDHGSLPETVVNSSQTTTNGAVSKEEKIRKPSNAWILYRQHQHKFLSPKIKSLPCSEISKMISNMWKNEKAEVKQEFFRRASVERERHILENPDWKCHPRKSSAIKKRVFRKKSAASSNRAASVDDTAASVDDTAASVDDTAEFELSRLVEEEQDLALGGQAVHLDRSEFTSDAFGSPSGFDSFSGILSSRYS